MGLKCKIVRNSDSTVDFVENPQGDSSQLYQDALEYTGDSNLALDLWSFAYSESFEEKFGKWDSVEPSLKDVLNTLTSIKNENKSITNEQLFGLTNNMLGLEIETVDDLYSSIQDTFYKDGYFNISEQSLQESGLYNESEIVDILSDSSVQAEIKNTVESFRASVLSRSPKITRLQKTFFKQEDFLLQDTSEMLGIGKYKNLIDEETQTYIAEQLAGVKNRDEFEERLAGLGMEDVAETYKNDKQFADSFFAHYSNLKRIPVYEFNDQSLSPKVENSKVVENTVMVGEESAEIQSDIDFILDIPAEVWEDSQTELTKVVKKIEKALINFNVDVIGLNEKLATTERTDFVNFLENMSSFVEGLQNNQVTSQDMGSFVGMVESFMEKESAPQISYDTVPQSQQDMTLIDVQFPTSALEMFKEHSMIETQSGYYHKIQREESLEQLYSEVYALAIQNPSILPKEVFYPYAFTTNNELDTSKLTNVPAVFIIENIQKYIEKRISETDPFFEQADLETLQEMYLYKTVLNHNSPVITKKAVNVRNENYLKDGFISDFYNYYLKEKFKNSVKFNNALKYFNFSDSGIGINTTNINTKQQIHTLLQDNSLFEKFLDYAKISKNKDLDFFAQIREDNAAEEKTLADERLEAINYPETVPVFRGEYQIKEGVLGTANATKNFIRVAEGVFELQATQRGVSFYQQLEQNPSRYYLRTKPTVTSRPDIDTTIFRNLEAPVGTSVSIDNLYTKKESTAIDEELGCTK